MLGAVNTRWKAVQAAGRLGRDLAEQAIMITIFEKKKMIQGIAWKLPMETHGLYVLLVAPAEREESHMVESVFQLGGCLRKGIYESFAVSNPTGTLLLH